MTMVPNYALGDVMAAMNDVEVRGVKHSCNNSTPQTLTHVAL